MKTAALVLSGGAFRGFAQFGALKATELFLKKNSIEVKTIVGTSFGAITASLTALGYNADTLIVISKKIGFGITNLRDLSIRGLGLLKGNKMRNHLKKYLDSKTFKDVNCDLIINAVDIFTGKQYLFTKKGLEAIDGSIAVHENLKLIDAVEASVAIPGIFQPKRMLDLMLVDGGLVNSLGTDLISLSSYDYVLCIDVSLAHINFIPSKNPRKFHMIQQAFSIMQRSSHFRKIEEIAKQPNVILIKPPVGPANPLNKHEMERMVECGFQEAKKILGV